MGWPGDGDCEHSGETLKTAHRGLSVRPDRETGRGAGNLRENEYHEVHNWAHNSGDPARLARREALYTMAKNGYTGAAAGGQDAESSDTERVTLGVRV